MRLYAEQLFNIQAVVPTHHELYNIEEVIAKKIVDMTKTINKTKLQIEKLKEAKQSLISKTVTEKINILD